MCFYISDHQLPQIRTTKNQDLSKQANDAETYGGASTAVEQAAGMADQEATRESQTSMGHHKEERRSIPRTEVNKLSITGVKSL